METGTKITEKELLDQGWVYIHHFGYSCIYGKDKDRILWNPKTNLIQLFYQEKNPCL